MAATQQSPARPAPGSMASLAFNVVAGLFFFVAIIKFGTPVILDNVVQPPDNFLGAVYESWQVKWGYLLMIPLVLAGLAAVQWNKISFKWPLIFPLAWLGWQFISATQTISPALTEPTLKHFSACCVFFYLGCFALHGNLWPVLTGMALALCWALHSGLEQHFGGLEATRHYVYSLQASGGLQPGMLKDPTYLKRIASSRIFGTFSNPDALAAGIELLLPATLVFMWQMTPKVRPVGRCAFVTILGGCALASLYWTGSKAAWLVTLVMALVALCLSSIPLKWKRLLVVGVLVLGVASFGIRMARSANKEKERASVVTRFAYWRGAIKVTESRPILGTGPGTFSASYKQVIRPGDDYAQLCHNDYLEQACDSGILGALLYLPIIVCSLILLYRYRIKSSQKFSIYHGILLGILGLALHSAVDYPIYIPALAWPMFFWMGFSLKNED
jgi:O-antigen ligase